MNKRTGSALLFAFATLTAPVRAQHAALETLADVELWKTDASSRLLAQNAGTAFGQARIHAFGVLRATPVLELRGIAEFLANTEQPSERDFDVELLSVRFFPARAFVLEAGRILMPMGSFGLRRFSNVNPLIGEPDLYPVIYPLGTSVSGGAGRFDYHAALVSLPSVNPRYSPAPGKRLRPVVGVGISAGPAFRAGAAITHGSYLGPDQAGSLPAGTAWQDFKQTVLATDFRYSVGYLDARAEMAWSFYDVPTLATPVRGFGWYAEARFTHTPRIYTSLRVERNRYPFVLPITRARWIGKPVTEMNGEAGIGYRVSQVTLLKVSYRRDYWPDKAPAGAAPVLDGYALAMQISVMTNIVGLFTRTY